MFTDDGEAYTRSAGLNQGGVWTVWSAYDDCVRSLRSQATCVFVMHAAFERASCPLDPEFLHIQYRGVDPVSHEPVWKEQR